MLLPTSFLELAKSVGVVASVVSQLKVCFFFFYDLLFPQILDFEILIDLDNFLDINHLIWYGFCCFLFCIFMGFDWILEWQVQSSNPKKNKTGCGLFFPASLGSYEFFFDSKS